MTILNGKFIMATAVSLVLTACGGSDTSETGVVEGDVISTVEEPAVDVNDAVQDSAAVAEDALEQGADSANAAVDSAAAAVSDLGDSAGWTDLQSNWQDSIGSIKDRWADLTEEELLAVDGDREALVSLVQEKYGMAREAAESEVNDWASAL